VSWTLRFRASAGKELLRLRDPILARVDAALLKLEQDPHAAPLKKLKNHPGFRLRVGDYRILCEISRPEKIIWVYAIRHRREAYRRSR
jgi:mRNA interferase RelE/StbE